MILNLIKFLHPLTLLLIKIDHCVVDEWLILYRYIRFSNNFPSHLEL
jgi:hypothetical protein